MMFDTPPGLTRLQTSKLETLADDVEQTPLDQLLDSVEAHALLATKLAEKNSFVNANLANLIAQKINIVAKKWNELSETHRFWLLGAIWYFVSSDDDEKDFKSPIGFEDDAEVLNACLRMANLDHLCISEEEF